MASPDPYTYRIDFDQNADGLVISSTRQFSDEAIWQVGQILAEDADPLYNVGAVAKFDIVSVPDPNA